MMGERDVTLQPEYTTPARVHYFNPPKIISFGKREDTFSFVLEKNVFSQKSKLDKFWDMALFLQFSGDDENSNKKVCPVVLIATFNRRLEIESGSLTVVGALYMCMMRQTNSNANVHSGCAGCASFFWLGVVSISAQNHAHAVWQVNKIPRAPTAL